MNCRNAKENLDALLDRDLENSATAAVEAHLMNCLSCRTDFENRQRVGAIMRRNLSVSAPSALDEKVFSAFRDFHARQPVEQSSEPKSPGIGWFAVPRLIIAAAVVLCAFTGLLSFQLGRMSAGEKQFATTENRRSETPETVEKNANTDAPAENSPVSSVEEKIIRIPIVREKIVTRIIYRDRIQKEKGLVVSANPIPENSAKEKPLMTSRLSDNRYSTLLNTEGFKLVSELKPQIIKGENNEK